MAVENLRAKPLQERTGAVQGRQKASRVSEEEGIRLHDLDSSPAEFSQVLGVVAVTLHPGLGGKHTDPIAPGTLQEGQVTNDSARTALKKRGQMEDSHGLSSSSATLLLDPPSRWVKAREKSSSLLSFQGSLPSRRLRIPSLSWRGVMALGPGVMES